MNLYEVLGVPRDASLGEVRHAYLAKAAQLSPARFAGAPAEVVEALYPSTRIMKTDSDRPI